MFLSDITPTFLRLGDYISTGESHHVGRRRVTGAFSGTLHTHDFAELLWIEEGALTHLVNGSSQLLRQGDVVFVRPRDRHTFRPVAGRGFTTVSVAFPADSLAFLQERYFGTARWPWSAGPLPSSHPLGVLQLARLRDLLASDTTSRLLLERVLLEVLDEVTGPTGTRLPLWLQGAIDSVAADPLAQGGGVTALAQRAGRSREHVNRVLREQTGQTATQTLNELRLTRAATELRMSDRPIAAVAADCGLSNLSHFYRLFGARFGTTPRKYRVKHAALIQGDAADWRSTRGDEQGPSKATPSSALLVPVRPGSSA